MTGSSGLPSKWEQPIKKKFSTPTLWQRDSTVICKSSWRKTRSQIKTYFALLEVCCQADRLNHSTSSEPTIPNLTNHDGCQLLLPQLDQHLHHPCVETSNYIFLYKVKIIKAVLPSSSTSHQDCNLHHARGHAGHFYWVWGHAVDIGQPRQGQQGEEEREERIEEGDNDCVRL